MEPLPQLFELRELIRDGLLAGLETGPGAIHRSLRRAHDLSKERSQFGVSLQPTHFDALIEVKEPLEEALSLGRDLDVEEATHYIERIKAIGAGLQHTGGCQDIQVHKIKGRIYLSFHLLIDADRPIAEVHDIAEEMENRLRSEFPQLGRVVIHSEPVRD